jgi:hypothetical protein
MTEQQYITVRSKSDAEQIVDLVTTIVGLVVLAYTLDPEPFDYVLNTCRARVHSWFHRLSVWEARQAIRSLPETEER